MRRMGGLGDWVPQWIQDLMGKSQAWYDNLNRVGNALTVANAGLNSVGKSLWDTVASEIAGSGSMPSGLPYFPGFDWMQGEIDKWLRASLVTQSYTPSDSDIATGAQRAREASAMVEYVKTVAPQIQAQVTRDQLDAQAKVEKITLYSPTKAGVKEFEKQVEDRAKALGLGLEITTLILIGLGVVAASIILPRVLGGASSTVVIRRNPHRRRSGGFELKKILPYAAMGAAGYFLLAPKPTLGQARME